MSIQTMYQSLQRKQKENGSDYAGTREYEFPTFHLLPLTRIPELKASVNVQDLRSSVATPDQGPSCSD